MSNNVSILLVFVGALFSFSCSSPTTLPTRTLDKSKATDFHMHIHSPPKVHDDLEFNAGRALLAADSVGISRALLLSNAYSVGSTKAYTVKENDFIISQAAKLKGKASAACAVNPKKIWWRDELKRCASLNVKVLKLHFMASGMDLRKMTDFELASKVLQEAEHNHLTIIIHANYPKTYRSGEIEKIKELIERFKNVRWIIGHAFGREIELLKNLNHPNYFVELSVVPIWAKTESDKIKLAENIRSIGVSKFVFGSDWPVIHPAEEMKAFEALPLTAEEKNEILYDNPLKLDDLFK